MRLSQVEESLSKANKPDTHESKEEMAAQIKLHHDNKLQDTSNAHAKYSALTHAQVIGMKINLMQPRGSIKNLYEFLDPTNGTFFLVYHKSINPFSDHDFSQPIANKFVRKLTETQSEYLKKFGKEWIQTRGLYIL